MLRELQGTGQWWLFLRIFVFAAVVPLLFRLKISVLSQLLERRIKAATARKADPATTELIIRCMELARAVGGPVIRPKCLTRSVTLYYFLRRAGMDLTLCFGAARKGDLLVNAAGHCWLVRNGEPYLEAGDPRANFLPIYWLPNTFPVTQ
jgi:hypothetical protein